MCALWCFCRSARVLVYICAHGQSKVRLVSPSCKPASAQFGLFVCLSVRSCVVQCVFISCCSRVCVCLHVCALAFSVVELPVGCVRDRTSLGAPSHCLCELQACFLHACLCVRASVCPLVCLCDWLYRSFNSCLCAAYAVAVCALFLPPLLSRSHMCVCLCACFGRREL